MLLSTIDDEVAKKELMELIMENAGNGIETLSYRRRRIYR